MWFFFFFASVLAGKTNRRVKLMEVSSARLSNSTAVKETREDEGLSCESEERSHYHTFASFPSDGRLPSFMNRLKTAATASADRSSVQPGLGVHSPPSSVTHQDICRASLPKESIYWLLHAMGAELMLRVNSGLTADEEISVIRSWPSPTLTWLFFLPLIMNGRFLKSRER